MQLKNKTLSLLALLIPYLRMPLGIFLLCLLQMQWPQILTWGEIKPNLLLILLFAETLGRSPLYGAFWGFIMGLVLDVFSGAFWGLFALTYALAGFGGGWLKQWFYLREFRVQLGAFILVLAAYQAVFFGIYHFLYITESWLRGLYRVLFPEALYTLVLGIAFLWLRLKINPTPAALEKEARL